MDDLNEGSQSETEGKKIPFPTSSTEAMLETVPNKWPVSNYTVELIYEEFVCLCPLSNQVDCATLYIEYIPEDRLVGSKSLKRYLESYQDIKISQEAVINQICHDLGSLLRPRVLEVRGEFSSRDGVRIIPTARWSV